MSVAEQPVPQQKPQRSWFGRNWWWVILLVIVGGGVMCCGVCGGVGYFVMNKLKSSEPYKMAVEALENDPVVIEKLGEPIAEPPFVGGSINESNGQGSAKLLFIMTGSNAGVIANVECNARLIDGKWGLTSVTVNFSDGQRYVLELDPDQTGGGLDDAPPSPWTPPGTIPVEGMP